MTPKATHSTPLLHVASIEASITFYEVLGFRVIDTDDGKPIGWARLHCETGDVMFLRAEEMLDPHVQGFMFCLYTPDLPVLREHLIAQGLNVSPIKRPGYMPSGTMNLKDPDGYHLEILHWGRAEHEAWKERLSERGVSLEES